MKTIKTMKTLTEAVIPDAQSTFLSSGCFLDALISGQLGPTVRSSFMLPEHAVSTSETPPPVKTSFIA
jgi:hypothetical protein